MRTTPRSPPAPLAASSLCAEPIKGIHPPSHPPPSRSAVPACDHRDSKQTAVFLRPPLLMGRRDERTEARPLAFDATFFFFFLTCQGSVWEKEQDGQAVPPTRHAETREVPPAFLPRSGKELPGQWPPKWPSGISTALRLPSQGHVSTARDSLAHDIILIIIIPRGQENLAQSNLKLLENTLRERNSCRR